ncbi:MAG TPA: hypothetical protein VGT41_06770 [Candidatus Babeliales bacterium]|nr:hypothetical protein [Candidatus Babeliales bacterium]
MNSAKKLFLIALAGLTFGQAAHAVHGKRTYGKYASCQKGDKRCEKQQKRETERYSDAEKSLRKRQRQEMIDMRKRHQQEREQVRTVHEKKEAKIEKTSEQRTEMEEQREHMKEGTTTVSV